MDLKKTEIVLKLLFFIPEEEEVPVLYDLVIHGLLSVDEMIFIAKNYYQAITDQESVIESVKKAIQLATPIVS